MEAPSLTPWKDRIRQERIRRNWRQQDLADQLDTTVVTIQRWERGAQLPSVYFRAKLCALFDKSAEELGLLPEAEPQDDASPLSPTEISLTDGDRSCVEEVPEAADAVEAPSIAEASPCTSTQQQAQPARSSFLTRRRLLVGLAGGALISIVGGGLVFLRSIASEHETLYTYHGHTNVVRAVAWCPKAQSQRIASAGDDKTVRVWTPRSGADDTSLIYRQHLSAVSAVAWAPDGELIASSAGLEVHVWNTFSGQRHQHYRGHKASVNAVAWSPDGYYVASGGEDQTVQVWGALNGKVHIGPLEHRAEVTGISWSPDGRYLASSSFDHKVRVWDAKTGASLQVYSGHTAKVNAVVWSPDSQYLASGGEDHTLQIWKPLEGTTSWSTKQPRAVWAVAWSPNNGQVAAADGGGTVQVFDVPGMHPRLSYARHRWEVRAVAWSPDGTRIASGGQDKTVQVWQVI